MSVLRVQGNKCLLETIRFCHAHLSTTRPQVAIIHFSKVAAALPQQVLAATISCRAKKAAFEHAGFRVNCLQLEETMEQGQFESVLRDLKHDRATLGIIIQRPIPAQFQRICRQCQLVGDLDANASDFPSSICAVAEATLRLIQRFAAGDQVTVVGGRGHVGSAVVQGLNALGISNQIIEQGESFDILQKTPVVVSATGQPHILTARHIGEKHRLLIDIGFAPVSVQPLVVYGDIDPKAYPAHSIVTPVPGGLGPLQISILLERAARIVGLKKIPDWNIELN